MDYKLHKTYQSVEQRHWWFVGRRKILYDVLKKHFPSRQAKLLDVGCNSGVLVEKLQRRGYDAWGTDISKEAIDAGKLRGVRNLMIAEGDRQPFEDGTFDCVLALDVIEHIEKDGDALIEFRRLLKPGGLLVVKVPAFMFMWGLQDEVAHHKRRYSKELLRTTIQSQGFEMVRLTYFNFFLFGPIALVRLLQKVYPPKRSSDFELNNPVSNWILMEVFLIESVLLRFVNLPFGVSLLAIAKK
jgi:2-polyprenyl-3-methyl-5-hydroxy-6-metoxy-1,4-benzoquinol methylase